MLEKIDELKRRTIDVLERTKKEKAKYAEERKIIDKFFVDSLTTDNLEECFRIVLFQIVIKL